MAAPLGPAFSFLRPSLMAGFRGFFALFLVAPLAAQASCESVKADITQKIIANGVPESGFTLDIVPNDQVNQAGGQVVGHCESDSHKIVYTQPC